MYDLTATFIVNEKFCWESNHDSKKKLEFHCDWSEQKAKPRNGLTKVRWSETQTHTLYLNTFRTQFIVCVYQFSQSTKSFSYYWFLYPAKFIYTHTHIYLYIYEIESIWKKKLLSKTYKEYQIRILQLLIPYYCLRWMWKCNIGREQRPDFEKKEKEKETNSHKSKNNKNDTHERILNNNSKSKINK